MVNYDIDWNITAGTLEWSEYTKVQYNDGTSKETTEPQSRDLGFARNTGTTDRTYTETINFNTETEVVNIKQKAQYYDYLRIEPLTSRINVWLSDPSLFNEFQYSLDGENFTDWNTSTQIQVPMNKIFYIRGKGLSTSDTPRTIHVSGEHFLTGNIRSLFAYESFSKHNNLYTENCFYGLFKGNTGLMQAQIRDFDCDYNTQPKLPDGCFREMFSGCTSLTRHTGPTAISAGNRSCYAMFADCTAITSSYCNLQYGDDYAYYGMYMNCSNLKSIIFSSAIPKGENAYERMFMNCTSLEDTGTVALGFLGSESNATKECYRLMFYGCTSLKKTPVIYTNPNASGAFSQLFAVCESLQEVTVRATVWDNTRNTAYWLQQVPPNGTFKKLATTNIPTDDEYGIPSGWSVVDIT